MGYRRISCVAAILLLCKSSTSIHHAFVLPPIVHTLSTDNNSIIQYKHSKSTALTCYSNSSDVQDQKGDIPNNMLYTQPVEEEKDTIRVRIWKMESISIIQNKEISLTQLNVKLKLYRINLMNGVLDEDYYRLMILIQSKW